MKKPGETLKANFGQEPFAFDIDKMMQDEKAAIKAEIERSVASTKATEDDTLFVHQLIQQYLAHDGYVETARAFSDETIEEARALANDNDDSVHQREPIEDVDALKRQSMSSN